MVRIVAYVDSEPVFPVVAYIAVETNVARYAFRAAATISQCVNSVQPNLPWTNLS